MDSILQKAEADIKAKEEQVALLQAEIQELRAAVRVVQKYASDSATSTEATHIRAVPAPGKSKREIVVEFVRDLLADGKPRHTREILDAVSKARIEIAGTTDADKVMNLSGYISREKSIFQTDRIKGWSLKTNSPESAPTQSGLIP